MIAALHNWTKFDEAGQGVLIAPPMPQERFLELLRQRASAAKPEARDQMSEVRYSGARV